MKTGCLMIALSLSFLCSCAQNTMPTNSASLTKPQAEVWGKVLELHKSVFGNKDSVTIEKLVSSKLHYGHSSGKLEEKAEMVHAASASTTVYENVTNDLISMNIAGNVAMVRLRLKASSIDKGTATPLDLGLLQVWAKENGAWKLMERQAVKMPVK